MRMEMRIFKTNHWKGYICEVKAWLEKGQGLTYMLKYLILLFGLASQDVYTTLYIGLVYIVIVLIIGFLWYKHDFIKWEIEVSNLYNLFVEEMRQKFK